MRMCLLITTTSTTHLCSPISYGENLEANFIGPTEIILGQDGQVHNTPNSIHLLLKVQLSEYNQQNLHEGRYTNKLIFEIQRNKQTSSVTILITARRVKRDYYILQQFNNKTTNLSFRISKLSKFIDTIKMAPSPQPQLPT